MNRNELSSSEPKWTMADCKQPTQNEAIEIFNFKLISLLLFFPQGKGNTKTYWLIGRKQKTQSQALESKELTDS